MDRWSSVIGLWQNLVVYQLKGSRRGLWRRRCLNAQLVKEKSAKMFSLQPNCSGIHDILIPPCFSWEPPSQPEVRRWLTFLSVAQRLSLSSDVQTQVSGLQSNTHTHRRGWAGWQHFPQSVMPLSLYLHFFEVNFSAQASIYTHTD